MRNTLYIIMIMCLRFGSFLTISGVGVTQTIGLLLASLSYCQVIAYAVYFMGASFATSLPWDTCSESWNTPGRFYNWYVPLQMKLFSRGHIQDMPLDITH